MLSKQKKLRLEKQQYRVIGNHSAVKICSWTKRSLRDEDICYKQKFYNIKSHLCCQMSPCLFCTNSCIFCWRDTSMLTSNKLNEKIDSTKEIIKGCIEGQRELLTGFKGNKKTNLKKWKQAQDPKYFAISLTGEPTMYPKLGELIKELKEQGKCTFLVTNGQFPDHLAKLKTLPIQLYFSLDAPNEKIYKKIDKPIFKDAWKRILKTLELIKNLKTRTCIRLTLIKGINMCNEEEYAALIKKAEPMFVEAKAYMFVGSSRLRLKISNMPRHDEIKVFAKKLAKLSGYKIIDEKKESRVVLLAKKDSKSRFLSF